jgi:hypothetical protein
MWGKHTKHGMPQGGILLEFKGKMNRLSNTDRSRVVACLVEGNSQ